MIRPVPQPKLLAKRWQARVRNNDACFAGRKRLVPEPYMQNLLVNERLRSERSQLPFSYVRYVFKGQAPKSEFLQELESFLSARLRATDHFGLVNKKTIGIVFPYTESSTIELLTREIQGWLEDHGYQCAMDVYQYPDGPDAPSDRRSSDDMWDSDFSDDETGLSSEGPWDRGKISVIKHFIDTLGSVFALILFAPIFLLVAIAIKATSRGPVFFVQERIGKGGRPFRLYKFRTMVVGAEQMRESLLAFNEQDGPAFKMKHDPRVTWIGNILRRTSLDELPQLINVLRRDMSLVGPRPLPNCEARACRSWQQRRHDVLPGITCVWQVSGRSRVSFDEWMRMDLHYVDHQTIWKDVKLLGKTIPAVFSCRGAV